MYKAPELRFLSDVQGLDARVTFRLVNYQDHRATEASVQEYGHFLSKVTVVEQDTLGFTKLLKSLLVELNREFLVTLLSYDLDRVALLVPQHCYSVRSSDVSYPLLVQRSLVDLEAQSWDDLMV